MFIFIFFFPTTTLSAEQQLHWHPCGLHFRFRLHFHHHRPLLQSWPLSRKHQVKLTWKSLHFGSPKRLDALHLRWLLGRCELEGGWGGSIDWLKLGYGRWLRVLKVCIPFELNRVMHWTAWGVRFVLSWRSLVWTWMQLGDWTQFFLVFSSLRQ